MRNELLSDLSYSAIVDKIDGNKDVGKELLVELLDVYFKRLNKVDELESKLRPIMTDISLIKSSVKYILDHLKLETPLNIVLDDKIIKITDNEILVETNII